MKLSGSTIAWVAVFELMAPLAIAGTVESYSRRNETYAPAATIPTATRRFETLPAAKAKRTTPAVLSVARAPAAASPAAIEVVGSLPKTVIPTRRAPSASVVEPDASLSWLAARSRLLTPGSSVTPPAFVAKYQSRMSSAQSVTIGRTPVPGRSGTASLNRFVFRRQTTAPQPASLPVAPAGK